MRLHTKISSRAPLSEHGKFPYMQVFVVGASLTRTKLGIKVFLNYSNLLATSSFFLCRFLVHLMALYGITLLISTNAAREAQERASQPGYIAWLAGRIRYCKQK